MKLTDKTLKSLKPAPTRYTRADGRGLNIEVWPNGATYWRFRYRYGGRAKTLSMGVYPETSLREARAGTDAARALLRAGMDPSNHRKAAKREAVSSQDRKFEKVAADWLDENRARWAAATYRKAVYVVDRYLVPSLRGTDVATLATPEARRAVKAIAAKTTSLAEKARGYLGSIMEFATHAGLRDEGRALSLNGSVPRKSDGHIPAATEPDDIACVARAVRACDSPVVRAALTLAMLTAQRPGTVAGALWNEFDLDAAEWRIPGERMKTGVPHISPLSTQAVAAVREMAKFSAGADFVFPPLARQTTPHLHRDALSAALRRMGFQGEHATHGFRAMFRTAARERLGIASDVLEAQLAHVKKTEILKAYDRAQFLDERRIATQKWADWIDTLRA